LIQIMTPLTTHQDVALVDECRRGSETAWRALVDRYSTLVFSTARRTGLDRDAAADVYQQVWIELYRSLPRLRNLRALPRWLIVATRRRSYRYALVSAKRVEGTFDELVDPQYLPDATVEQAETCRRLEFAVSTMGEPCARLLRLLFLERRQLSYREIAGLADIPIGSIGPVRARCLTRLRKAWEVEQ
jgi:RNA polymerase sigma factor (sigma-70 family)